MTALSAPLPSASPWPIGLPADLCAWSGGEHRIATNVDAPGRVAVTPLVQALTLVQGSDHVHNVLTAAAQISGVVGERPLDEVARLAAWMGQSAVAPPVTDRPQSAGKNPWSLVLHSVHMMGLLSAEGGLFHDRTPDERAARERVWVLGFLAGAASQPNPMVNGHTVLGHLCRYAERALALPPTDRAWAVDRIGRIDGQLRSHLRPVDRVRWDRVLLAAQADLPTDDARIEAPAARKM